MPASCQACGVVVDEACESLSAVLAELGLGPLRRPSDLGPLERLQRTIAPMVVPADVCRWWSLVDPEAVPVLMLPQFTGPTWALERWEDARDEFAADQPLALLTVGYESQHLLSVELETPAGPGGGLYEWGLVDGDFVPAFVDIAGWVEAVTAALVNGRGEVRDWGSSRRVVLEHDAVRRRPAEASAVIERDILSWPPHWQQAAGLELEAVQPRGATHSIAGLLRERPSGIETIRGRVASLSGSSAGEFVRIHDGTAELAVRCPRDVTLLGPVIDAWFEFDVELVSETRGGLSSTPDDPVLAKFQHRFFGWPDAVARGVRRLDDPPA